MPVGVLLAVASAVTRGCAAVLQSVGASRVTRFPGVDARLFLVLLRSRLYVAGLVLDGASFGFALLALRRTPLFVVQAIGAASLALVAVLSVGLLRERLPRMEEVAVGAVVLGVALLAVSGRPNPSVQLGPVGEWGILVAAVILTVLAFTVARRTSGPALPGLLAGFAFGDSAVAARVIGASGLSVTLLLRNPMTYAVTLCGVVGTLLYAAALQHGSVTLASGVTTVGQTVAPGVVGWLLLGDDFRPGFGMAAGAGFILATVGALGLARHGQGVGGARRSRRLQEAGPRRGDGGRLRG